VLIKQPLEAASLVAEMPHIQVGVGRAWTVHSLVGLVVSVSGVDTAMGLKVLCKQLVGPKSQLQPNDQSSPKPQLNVVSSSVIPATILIVYSGYLI